MSDPISKLRGLTSEIKARDEQPRVGFKELERELRAREFLADDGFTEGAGSELALCGRREQRVSSLAIVDVGSQLSDGLFQLSFARTHPRANFLAIQ